MDPLVFAAVLAAAFMHASWNAVVKTGLDPFSSILLLGLIQGAVALILLPFFAFPAAASWPWLAGSALLHTGYKLFLIRAYAHGDLGQIYPLARGSAPVIVALLGFVLLNEAIGLVQAAAVAAIALGVAIMSLRGGVQVGRMPAAALGYALGTAAFTAAYTMADAVGARLSASVSGFTMAMFAIDGLALLGAALVARGPGVLARLRPAWRSGAVAGILSLGSYWIAIWAFTRAPIALVAALRETSVLFAMLLGVFLLGERGGRWRWGAALLILAGIVILRP